MKQGLIHIYCGDGKGKTTAAVGLAVRAAGAGKKVLFAEFMKDGSACEIQILKQLPGVEVTYLEQNFGFVFAMTEVEKENAKAAYTKLWNQVTEMVSNGSYDMLVVDEFMSAYEYDFIPKESALDFLKNRKGMLEVVLTGRHPEKEIQEIADYITEAKKIKHPMEQGIPARKGIEY